MCPADQNSAKMSQRGSGILLHIVSLPSPYGIGDLGPSAYRFADFLAETGQRFWQLLPLSATGWGENPSPYNGISTFAGNTMMISPDLLADQGWLDGGTWRGSRSCRRERLIIRP